MAERDSSNPLPWLLGGVAVGAAIGLLLAPKAGRESREDVKDWLRNQRERSRELVARLRERIPSKKEQVAAALRAGRDAFQNAGNHKNRETIAA